MKQLWINWRNDDKPLKHDSSITIGKVKAVLSQNLQNPSLLDTRHKTAFFSCMICKEVNDFNLGERSRTRNCEIFPPYLLVPYFGSHNIWQDWAPPKDVCPTILGQPPDRLSP